MSFRERERDANMVDEDEWGSIRFLDFGACLAEREERESKRRNKGAGHGSCARHAWVGGVKRSRALHVIAGYFFNLFFLFFSDDG